MPKSTEYDHRRKVGNLGDVFKHPILIAGLRELTKSHNAEEAFIYVDLFSAYPFVELENEEIYGWKQGVRKFFDKNRGQTGNPCIDEWLSFVELPTKETKGIYPGSIQIAHRILRESGLDYKIFANDLGKNAFAQLSIYAMGTNTEADKTVIRVTPKKAQEIDLTELKPDFVFIDPPNITTKEDYAIEDYEKHVQQLEKTPFMTWIPAFPKNEQIVEELEKIGNAKRIGVRWAKNSVIQKSVGCHLLYRAPEKAEEEIKKTFDALRNYLKLEEI